MVLGEGRQFVGGDLADLADIVLPAASYLETDDLYRAYGAYWMQWGQKAVEPAGEARSNFHVAQALAHRMGGVPVPMQTTDPQLRRLRDDLIAGHVGVAEAVDRNGKKRIDEPV